jgi:hypothetical protein
MPRLEVIHIGAKAFQDALQDIMNKDEHDAIMVDSCRAEIESLGKNVAAASTGEALEVKLVEAKASQASVAKFHDDITRSWSAEIRRVLGYVFCAPSISVSTGEKQFTEDWALIELYDDKFDWDTFQGNVIHFGMFRSISLESFY